MESGRLVMRGRGKREETSRRGGRHSSIVAEGKGKLALRAGGWWELELLEGGLSPEG